MKESFSTISFRSDSLAIIEQANQICARYARQGYDLSLRQLYYQFVSRDMLANTEQNYKRLGSIISDARLAGLIDWEMIKDRGRETLANPHWEDPDAFMTSVAPQFRIDTWEGQPNYVEVMVEKQALEGVLSPVCRSLDIPFTSNKGYSSSSALYETGKRLKRKFVGEGSYHDYDFYQLGEEADPDYFESDADYIDMTVAHDLHDKGKYQEATQKFQELGREFMKPHPKGGRVLHVIYLGDHDPSGIDMTRDVKKRLELLSGCPVTVHRVALNMDQIRLYRPPENPAKTTDSRSSDYIRKFGTSSWELDALEPSTLATLVRDMVTELRDDTLYEAAVKRQSEWRDELTKLAQQFKSN